MKFAHDFKETLSREGFPSHWVESAIPYSQLKKVLKRVAGELNDLGLDPETLRQLLDPQSDSPLVIEYGLKVAQGSEFLRPQLTVLLHLQDGVAVDVSLSSSSRTFLEHISSLQANSPRHPALPLEQSLGPPKEASTDGAATSESHASFAKLTEPADLDRSGEAISTSASPANPLCKQLEVPLVFDGKFFDMLQSDVNGLDALQASEEVAMTKEIVALGQDVSQLTKPSRLSKSDLARWRTIFELYLEAQVFFSVYEQDHGTRDSHSASRQLQWFQGEVTKRNLARQFKMSESREALVRFLRLNALLLKNIQFQEINRTAIHKILKKFDKRTSLGVSKTFPAQIRSDKLLAGTMARDMCAQVSTELVSVVPQLNDYLCPVCFAIAYRPVRLACQHIFCIRCIVKIQRRREKHCPLCRADVVMDASAVAIQPIFSVSDARNSSLNDSTRCVLVIVVIVTVVVVSIRYVVDIVTICGQYCCLGLPASSHV
ncbi:RING-14 protein [Verticillium alfalfae VaMs.102]|uniref:RING-14 protein n=1 Tax=Verticillium alfalfae (strain VaMs.102 / ATCC MYA-4576 / FGSC 10136) TaxID=526221 RepID=C9SXQ3_VERA1|nr:RING-14 protein [Verticillium alfalfae VaMs.102]EEY23568.1 RING-14 protein [Verticillium alfalfae VaMs.102]